MYGRVASALGVLSEFEDMPCRSHKAAARGASMAGSEGLGSVHPMHVPCRSQVYMYGKVAHEL